jgi:hypothetical protein
MWELLGRDARSTILDRERRPVVSAATTIRMGAPSAEYLLEFSTRFVRICSIRSGSAKIGGGSLAISTEIA